MQQLLEPVEGRAVAKDPDSDQVTVRRPVLAQDLLAEALDERAPYLRIGLQEVVDDLVARDRRRPVTAKRLEGRALSGADSAGDRDGERAAQRSGLGRGVRLVRCRFGGSGVFRLDLGLRRFSRPSVSRPSVG